MLGELITDDRLWRLSAGRHGGGGYRSPAQADRRSQARPPGRRYRDRLRGLGADRQVWSGWPVDTGLPRATRALRT